MVRTTISLTERVYNDVKRIAKEKGHPACAVMRDLIWQGTAEYDRKHGYKEPPVTSPADTGNGYDPNDPDSAI